MRLHIVESEFMPIAREQTKMGPLEKDRRYQDWQTRAQDVVTELTCRKLILAYAYGLNQSCRKLILAYAYGLNQYNMDISM